MAKLKKNQWVLVKQGTPYMTFDFQRSEPGKAQRVWHQYSLDYDRAERIARFDDSLPETRVWLGGLGGFLPADVQPIEAIDAKILNFKQEFTDAINQMHRDNERYIQSGRPSWVKTKPHINWDESWDGLLLDRIQKLREAGFEITDFWRKQKIKMRKPKDLTHGEIVTKIIAAVGDEFTGITFKPGISVWWGATTRKWW